MDAAEWDAAVAEHRLPVFYSRAFLTAYERHPPVDIEAFSYLTVRRSGRVERAGAPAAVLPAYVLTRPDPLGCLFEAFPEAAGERVLLGHVWHCYDGRLGGLVADPAAADAALTALRERARELGVRWCGLVNIRRDGPTAAALTLAGYPLRPLSSRFTADFTDAGDVGRLTRRLMRPRTRSNLERHLRRAAEYGVRAGWVPLAEADLAGLTALSAGLAQRHGSDCFYLPGRFEPFLAALGPAAHVVEVRQRGRLLASGVCLVDEHRFHSWAGGADYDVDGNFSPYYVMYAEILRHAVRLGRPEFEGGRGNPTFKLRHGLTPRPLDGCLVTT